MDVSPDLIQKIVDGDMDAYETFVKETWAKSVRACWIILGEQRDAEEATQDAYVSLYKKRDQLREIKKFSQWFYRILMNSAKQVRRHRRTPSIPFQEDLISLEDLGQSDLKVSVQLAMRKLTEKERASLVLCYFANLTDVEASSVVGWHLGTYKWRLSKAKRHLKKIMSDEAPSSIIKGGNVL